MERKTKQILEATRLPDVLRILLRDDAIGGKLLLGATVLALLVANSPLNPAYQSFWHYQLSIGIDQFAISLDLQHWVSEGLMAIFFLVVGLEIKREIVKGQLRNPRTAVLPIAAAIGGMVMPALFFLAFNYNHPATINGWAIPIATDIVFAIGVMSLLGNRVSSSLKLFLLTLAIVDDIGAIIIIALFYSTDTAPLYLLLATLIVITIMVINSWRAMTMPIFILLGVALWVAFFESGVHASIAGALLGLLAPLGQQRKGRIANKLEKVSIPISTFVVVPLFAFASLGIVLDANKLNGESYPLVWGILAGLIIGKVLGITLTSWIVIKLKLAKLPHRTNWYQLIGVGFIAGIGFTVSVFVAELAFPSSDELTNIAKISVLVASTISAVIGYLFLRHRGKVGDLLKIE